MEMIGCLLFLILIVLLGGGAFVKGGLTILLIIFIAGLIIGLVCWFIIGVWKGLMYLIDTFK